MPIADVIRMGAHANHNLAVFNGVSGEALALYRTKRLASPSQRIMLIARDGGCTKPCCTVGAYGCQAHHASRDWRNGGNTNTDDMALACGPDSRLADGVTGWQTTINTRAECEWHPPPDLDHGQSRINYLHRAEALLRSPEDSAAPEPALLKRKRHNATHVKSRSLNPTETPGGPEPPDNQAA